MGASQTSAILLLLLLFQCSKIDSTLLRFLGQLFLFLCVYCLFPTQAFVLLASSCSSVGDPVPLEGSLGKYSKSFQKFIWTTLLQSSRYKCRPLALTYHWIA